MKDQGEPVGLREIGIPFLFAAAFYLFVFGLLWVSSRNRDAMLRHDAPHLMAPVQDGPKDGQP